MHSNTTSTTELQRQSAAYASIRSKLINPPPSRKQVEKLEQRIAELESVVNRKDGEILSISSEMLAAKREASAELARERAKHDKLKRDHSDLQCAFIEQGKRVNAFDDSISRRRGGEVSARRPVSEIVGEVLADYQGVTWSEIRSRRRLDRLVEPRKACIRAVHAQRTDLSSVEIGRIFERHHTSILYAVGAITKGRG